MWENVHLLPPSNAHHITNKKVIHYPGFLVYSSNGWAKLLSYPALLFLFLIPYHSEGYCGLPGSLCLSKIGLMLARIFNF